MSLPTRAIRWGGLAAMLAGVAVLAQIIEALLLAPPGLGALSPLSPYSFLYLALLSASWLFALGGWLAYTSYKRICTVGWGRWASS